MFDFLMETPAPQNLRAARLQLESGDGPDPLALARALHDVSAVEDAAAFFESEGELESASRLRNYMENRANGVWTPLAQAAPLARLVADAKEARAHAESGPAEQPPPPPPPKGLFAAVRGFFGAK